MCLCTPAGEVLHSGDLPSGGVLHDELFSEVEELAIRAVDEIFMFIPDIKMVERQKFLFQIKNHGILSLLMR